MKKFIEKNLPFLSILIIAALFITPFIVANDFADFGDVNDFSDFGDFSDFADFGDANDFSDFGDANDFSDFGDSEDFSDTGDSSGVPPAQPGPETPDDETDDSADDSPFDPILYPDNDHPGLDDDIPPVDEPYEAIIDLEISDNPDPVEAGEEIVYTITYFNRGYWEATDVVIKDIADDNAPLRSADPMPDADRYEWHIGNVPAKTGGTITIRAEVDEDTPDGRVLANTVTAAYFDQVYGNKLASETEYTRVSSEEDKEPIPEPPVDDDEIIGIKILSTRFPVESVSGESFMMVLRIENDGTDSLEDIKIAVVNQELGLRTSAGPFDLGTGDDITKTLLLDIPEYTPEGNYFLRFTITSNGETRRVVYRDIDVVSTLE